MNVMLKSAYLPYEPKDGMRYLVETMWPEGVDTHALSPFFWAHELAPSYSLKEKALWKHWHPEKFRTEYRMELQRPRSASLFALVLSEAREKGVTLLHRSRKREPQILPEDTSAYYLKEFLEAGPEKNYQLARPQALSAANQVQQWANEGGK